MNPHVHIAGRAGTQGEFYYFGGYKCGVNNNVGCHGTWTTGLESGTLNVPPGNDDGFPVTGTMLAYQGYSPNDYFSIILTPNTVSDNVAKVECYHAESGACTINSTDLTDTTGAGPWIFTVQSGSRETFEVIGSTFFVSVTSDLSALPPPLPPPQEESTPDILTYQQQTPYYNSYQIQYNQQFPQQQQQFGYNSYQNNEGIPSQDEQYSSYSENRFSAGLGK
jgi:hypothetical protein